MVIIKLPLYAGLIVCNGLADAQFLAGRATTTESGTDAVEKDGTANSSFFSPEVCCINHIEKSHLNLFNYFSAGNTETKGRAREKDGC